MANVLERAITSLVPTGEKRSALSGAFPFFGFGGLTSTSSGKVKNDAALTLPAFYNAMDQITNDLAKLPKAAYQKTDNGREKLSNHRVSYIINREPNNLMTAFMFWKMMGQAAILRGNGIARIHHHSRNGRLEELEFIHPDKLRDIKKIKGELWYYLDGEETAIHQSEIFHIPGFSFNGVYGISIIKYACQTLNIALNAQVFTNDSFDGRGLGLGSIETEKDVHPDVKKVVESKVDAKLSGPGKIKTVVLDAGMTYKSIQITPQEAQIIEQGKISVLDICRFMNINPHKVKMLDGANYSVLELLNIEHASDSIMPWAIKCQQECDRKLFTAQEKATDHYVKFSDNILLRADQKTKGEYYSKMVQAGIFTRNEVRGFEEMNELEGLSEPLTPVNTQIWDQIQKNLQNGNA